MIDAPSHDDLSVQRYLSGSAGYLFNQMLERAGIDRRECYITSVVKYPCADFDGRLYTGKTPTAELQASRQSLVNEINSINPTLTLLLGNEPLKAFGINDTISDIRGTMVKVDGRRFLPTYPPNYVQRMYEHRPIVECDLAKALRQALNPYEPKTYFNIQPRFHEVIDALKRNHKRLALDIETISTNIVRCIGLAWSTSEAICIPFLNGSEPYWSETEEAEILELLNQRFNSTTEFVLQNSPFDLTFIGRELHLAPRHIALDTMFGHHTLHPELPKGLDFLCSVYTDHPKYWNYDFSNDKQTYYYNCMDCVVTYEVALAIEQELQERGLMEFYQSIIQPSVFALGRMQSRGVRVNETLRSDFATSTQEKMEKLKQSVRVLSGVDINLSSPQQVKKLVYDTWGLPPQFKRVGKKRSVTTDDDALRALVKKCGDPTKQEILRAIIEYRQSRVFLSTFCNMPLKNGRAHTSYNPGGTVTGRISSSSTYDGYGGNLQNIPRGKFRNCFIADEGKVLIKADLSQAEYRVLIWKARIRRVIDKFLHDPSFSIHKWNASENIYRVPIENVTPKMYQDAKNGVYGANYGIGALKVSRMYDIPTSDAKFIITRYHEAVPEIIQVYQKEIEQEVQTTRQIKNPLGRIRQFMGRMDDELFRSAYSHYCQSTVADLILLALIELDDLDVELLLQIHDELVIQAPVETVVESSQRLKKALERPVSFPGVAEPLVIPADVKVGFTWGSCVPLETFLKERGNNE